LSSSTPELVSIFERALSEALPESHNWERGWTHQPDGKSWWLETSSQAAPDGRKLGIYISAAGDVTVSFFVGPTGVGRGPYGGQLAPPEGEEEEAEALEDTARFVADLVEERLVLAERQGWLTGGTEFIEPTELTPERRRNLEWVASWRGTYDWKVPE
jgi:hypothetical protein